MRFLRSLFVASMCVLGASAVAQLIYPGTLSWGAATVTAANGLPALNLDAGVPFIDAGTKWADGGPNCLFLGFNWVDAGGFYPDGGELDGGPFVFDAGYFCDGGMTDGGPVYGNGYGNPATFCDAGAQYPRDGGGGGYFDGGNDAGPGCYLLPISIWSDAGVICYDSVGDGGPYSDRGPVLADGGPVLRIDAGIFQVCDAGAAAYINADGGTILADAGPWLTSQAVNVGSQSALSVVCIAAGSDPEPAGNIQIQGSNDGQNWFLDAPFAPFDGGPGATYAWTLTSGQNPWPLVRVAVLNANDAGTLQCTMWAKH